MYNDITDNEHRLIRLFSYIIQSMKAPDLKEKLEESEKLLKEMRKTWEEKLAETEKIQVVCFLTIIVFIQNVTKYILLNKANNICFFICKNSIFCNLELLFLWEGNYVLLSLLKNSTISPCWILSIVYL